MPFPARSILVTGETYKRLVLIAEKLKKETGRSWTFGEVVDDLIAGASD